MKNSSQDWKILVLELDQASKHLGNDLKNKYGEKVTRFKLNNGCENKSEMEKVFKRVRVPSGSRTFTVYGSGKYHHYTYGLCRFFADRLSDSYAYIHFDHHDDRGDYHQELEDKNISCGSFVASILTDTNARVIRSIGNNPTVFNESRNAGREKIFSDNNKRSIANARFIKERKFRNEGIPRSISYLLQGTPRDVYISSDLDVLHEDEISTDYFHGQLKMEEYLNMLELICRRKHVIGADLLGYNGRRIRDPQFFEKAINIVTRN